MRLRFIIPLVLFLALSAFMFMGLYNDPRKVPSALIDKPAPEFALPTLYNPGKVVTKKDLLGRVYMLNVWASWCEACQYEHTYLVDLKNGGEKTPIIGYNYRDKTAPAKQWLEVLGDPYEEVIVDQKGTVAIDFGVYGAPETFFIDKKGIIRYKHIGPVTPDAWAKELKPLLQKLEAE